jgi:hypothetical protein
MDGKRATRVHIDFLGPLPETNSGNSNILVMVDQFTKWVEIIPLSSQTAVLFLDLFHNIPFSSRKNCSLLMTCLLAAGLAKNKMLSCGSTFVCKQDLVKLNQRRIKLDLSLQRLTMVMLIV